MLRRSFLCSSRYDVCIIGGGPAGIAAAQRATDFGKSACVVEQHRVGGKDVWSGTMHSKALFEMAKFSSMCRGSTVRRCLKFPSSSMKNDDDHHQHPRNLMMNMPKPDFCVAKDTIRAMCEKREQQILHQLSCSRIDLKKGKATFTSPYELCVYDSDGGQFESISADYFIVATGARPRRPPQFKADGQYILNSEQILSQPFPNSLLIIGGGGVGCEYAAIYSNLGTTKVSVLENDMQILPRTDADVHHKVKALFREKGVTMYENYELQTLRVEDNVVCFAARNRRTGEIEKGHCERALLALGRVPNYERLGLEGLLGTVIQNGRISFDKFGRCVPFRHIYVTGDAAGGKTVRTAETQGRSVVEHAFSFRPQSGVNFSETHETRILFADQEVATVGFNEVMCKNLSIAYRVATYSFEHVSRAMAMNNTKGFVKILVTQNRQQNVLGVTAIGPQASSIVEIASTAVQQQRQVHEFDALFVAYPALAQAFQECARCLRGTSAIKPGVAGVSIRSWSPEKPRGRGYIADEEQAQPFAIETSFQ